jgi:hypothetical protein
MNALAFYNLRMVVVLDFKSMAKHTDTFFALSLWNVH